MRHTLGLIATVVAIATSIGCQSSQGGQQAAAPPQAAPAPQKVELAEAREKAEFVFLGTVQKIGASSVAEVGSSSNSVVVRVDQVLTAPKAVQIRPEDLVTIAVVREADFSVGTQAIFYTRGWLYGSGVALFEMAHEDPKMMASMAAAQLEVENARFAARIRAADMVVLGTVEETRPAPQTGEKWITEHDPMWQEAVVKVTMGIKGATADQTIIVRFPASMDVAWYRAPKLKVDQQATLFMKRDQVTGLGQAMIAGTEVESFTALSPDDVMGAAAAQRIKGVADSMPK